MRVQKRPRQVVEDQLNHPVVEQLRDAGLKQPEWVPLGVQPHLLQAREMAQLQQPIALGAWAESTIKTPTSDVQPTADVLEPPVIGLQVWVVARSLVVS